MTEYIDNFSNAKADIDDGLSMLCEIRSALYVVGNKELSEKISLIINLIEFGSDNHVKAFNELFNTMCGNAQESAYSMVSAALAAIGEAKIKEK